MDQIQVKILNPDVIEETKRYMALGARITQHSHDIANMDDLMNLLSKPVSDKMVQTFCELPHPTLQKFTTINVAIVGASRRFLAQITRHQNEVKFMSGSLQYSDYTGKIKPVVPYELLDKPDARKVYEQAAYDSLLTYGYLTRVADNDTAGYISPSGMRNVLFISATPYQWKHMISQRICRRNTSETKYVMLKIWEQLYDLSPELFSISTTSAECAKCKCLEGKMSCGKRYTKTMTPRDILQLEFPKLCKE